MDCIRSFQLRAPNLDVEVKKYVLLHARVDSIEQLETP